MRIFLNKFIIILTLVLTSLISNADNIYWTNYPVVHRPAATDTFLLASPTGGLMEQFLFQDLLDITKTNAQSGFVIQYSNSPNIYWTNNAYPESDWATNANFTSAAIGTPSLGSVFTFVITNSNASAFITNTYPFTAFSLFAGVSTTTGVIPPAQIVKFVFSNGGNGIVVSEYGQDNANLVALAHGNAQGLTNSITWSNPSLTNQLLMFDAGIHTLTVTNSPLFLTFAGANGSWSIIVTNPITIYGIFPKAWLVNSNNILTNGVLSISSYGGTNDYQMAAAIHEKP